MRFNLTFLILGLSTSAFAVPLTVDMLTREALDSSHALEARAASTALVSFTQSTSGKAPSATEVKTAVQSLFKLGYNPRERPSVSFANDPATGDLTSGLSFIVHGIDPLCPTRSSGCPGEVKEMKGVVSGRLKTPKGELVFEVENGKRIDLE
ncbi:hypothetical protein GYMLUDRAFT_258909 [Collybiopsis luxurians FD-317 M1]|nr:hypothetical protein GYMLUDRAFT_258909 [Collybiopsis luxurians FD-317 M1]